MEKDLREIDYIGFQLEKNLKKKLAILCVKKDITLTDFFLNAINDALNEEGVENDYSEEKE
jgi:hypothetical protein